MKFFQLKPLTLALAACAYTAGTLQVALADDTEIYVPKEIPADQQVRPNILFILDSSGSMSTTVPGTGRKSRLTVMHEVVSDLIDSLKGAGNVNIGFMRYGGRNVCGTGRNTGCSPAANEHGGHVIYPVTHLNSDAEAKRMKDVVKDIPAADWTPLLETYYEAYRYLSGQDTYFSANNYSNRNKTGSVNGRKFVSPINHSCQKTHIIYVTDGEPTRDIDAHDKINDLIAGKNTKYTKCDTSKNRKDGSCLPHLAEYMANNDIAPRDSNGKKPFADPTGRMQTVTSHFIGFALDLKLLKDAADAGGGKYYTSDNVSGLVDALQSIIVDITADNTTFVAPSVAVTAYNNFGFRDELYYALFRPSEGSNWIGNVKKYKLKTRDADGNPITPMIVDRNGTQAIDPETGFFKETASSFWNTVVDGEDVGKGGFAAGLTSNNRKIYTWYGDDKSTGSADAIALESLSSNGTLATQSAKISNNMLGVGNDAQRTAVLNWIMGKNTDGKGNRFAIGDILHNEPRLIAYTTDENIERAEGPDSKEEVIIFVGTNEGFIHAIDAKTGNEKFAFLPKELLHVPNKYLSDNKGYNNKAYGMDGYFTTLVEYHDRVNDTRKAKKVNLYAGMRRGGSNYYALDVKDLDSPKLKWVLKGAYKDNYRDLIYQDATTENYDNIYRPTSGATDITPGFERLGLTYSAAKVGKLKVGGTEKDVLVFTGGYDVKHDVVGDNLPKNDEVGNSIYIVDAETGKLLWRASGSNGRPQTDTDGLNQMTLASMTNSMPASPTLIDINNDGLIDIIYATDLRGQIFRFDIEDGSVDDIKGHLFARLGGSDKANNRRFFNSPDVALIRDRGQAPYFTVSVGSGFRENPLNEETDDRFYMIRDTYVTQSRSDLSSPPVITENDLTDVSGLDSSQANADAVYAKVAEYQSQIDALDNAVKNAEQALEDFKNSTGYSGKYNEYLSLLAQANDLQREIDGITQGSYPPFDPDDYEEYTHYNHNYLASHAAETAAQAELQKLVVAMHNALGQLDEDSDDAKTLARYYQGLLALQEDLEESANKLISNENFILRGHAKPELTEDLKAEINARFPDVIQPDEDDDGDGFDLGDFSDIAHLLDASIQGSYAGRTGSGGAAPTDPNANASTRNNLIENLENLKEALTAESIDIEEIASLLGELAPAAPEDVDIQKLLNSDQSAKQTELEQLAQDFKSSQDQVIAKSDAMADVNDAAETALLAAEDIENDNIDEFDNKRKGIENAYDATRHPETGIYALRVKINDEYKKLDLAGDTMSEEQKAHLRNSSGFMLRLPRGEKVLADSISYSGTVLFSTFSPRGEAVSECGSDVGVGRTYGLSLRTAEGVFTTEIGGETKAMRSMLNKQAGIPPSPTVMLIPSPICEDEDCAPPPPPCENGLCIEYYDPITPTYWREAEQENL